MIDRKLPIADAVAEPRLHHQWLPDEVLVERGFSPRPDARAARRAAIPWWTACRRTSANSILVTPDGFVGAADPRRAARWRRDISARSKRVPEPRGQPTFD